MLRLRGRLPRQLVPAARGFSSSSDGPRFDRGFQLASRLWRRTVPKLGQLETLQENGAFSSHLGMLGQVWLFMQLQLPQKTEVDLVEFLEGAKMAAEENLLAMNNVEFPRFLAEEVASSDVAARLQQFTTPAYYNRLALQVKTNYLRRRLYVECEQMTIEKAQLAQVMYRRLTEKEYDDLVAFKKPPAATSPDASVEHLRLHVDVSTVEDLNLVFMEEETRHVQQQNVYRVIFESKVTEPEDVDWRIESMHLIEQKAIPRSQQAAKNAEEEQ